VGTWDQWPAQNWTGWDVYWERVAGQHISMGGGDSWLAHSDAIDSTAMVTDETGAMVWDQVFGPWGQIWQQTRTRCLREKSLYFFFDFSQPDFLPRGFLPVFESDALLDVDPDAEKATTVEPALE
jgi:hypothetical protein